MSQAWSDRAAAVPGTLTIRLAPDHLGSVNASMKMAGAQLEIEIQVESHEAMRHLQAQKHAMEASLRSLGYDLGQLTIIQSSVVSTSAPGGDGAPAPTGGGAAGGEARADGNSSSGGDGSNDRNADRTADPTRTASREAARSAGGDRRGVYI